MNEQSVMLIDTIVRAAEEFEAVKGTRPTVFMTEDLIRIMAGPSYQSDLHWKSVRFSVAGYELKKIQGRSELYIGCGVPVPPLNDRRIMGEWKRTDAYPHRIYCSLCHGTYVTNEEIIAGRSECHTFCTEAEYCPHCGARMKGDKE